MKKAFRWMKGAAIMGLLLFVSSLVSAQGQNPADAVVLSTGGYVNVTFMGAAESVPLVEGTRLGVGDVIETGDEGKVELMLADKSRLVIGQESRVVIKELGLVEVTKVSTSAFELLKGKIRAIVSPFVTRDSQFKIETNNATVGVRGTDFGETYDPDFDATYVLGFEGSLMVNAKRVPGVSPITVNGGEELTLSGAEGPPKPSPASGETIDQFKEGMGTTSEGGRGRKVRWSRPTSAASSSTGSSTSRT